MAILFQTEKHPLHGLLSGNHVQGHLGEVRCYPQGKNSILPTVMRTTKNTTTQILLFVFKSYQQKLRGNF